MCTRVANQICYRSCLLGLPKATSLPSLHLASLASTTAGGDLDLLKILKNRVAIKTADRLLTLDVVRSQALANRLHLALEDTQRCHCLARQVQSLLQLRPGGEARRRRRQLARLRASATARGAGP